MFMHLNYLQVLKCYAVYLCKNTQVQSKMLMKCMVYVDDSMHTHELLDQLQQDQYR